LNPDIGNRLGKGHGKRGRVRFIKRHEGEYLHYYGSPNATAIVIFVAGIVTGTFYNIMVTSNYSLISAMCAYPEEESLLSSNRMTGSNAGRMIAGYLVPVVVVAMLPALRNMTYILISVLCSGFMLITYLIHFKISEGFEGNGKVGTASGERLTVKEMAAAVAATPQIIALILANVNSTVNAFLLPGLMISFPLSEGKSYRLRLPPLQGEEGN
jgi:GPH family glycoside/pentoside/hexuronide:cation symporter